MVKAILEGKKTQILCANCNQGKKGMVNMSSQIKERPILFSKEMIRAILENRKSQTRRIVKPQPDNVYDGEPYWNIRGYRAYQKRGITDPLRMGTFDPLLCPYGEVFDRLWVRETWARVTDYRGSDPGGAALSEGAFYRADYPSGIDHQDGTPLKWRPSIFMPRRASRINLEIINIRVERLQEISVEDALAEGIIHRSMNDPRVEYQWLWESINGPGSWDINPWVWVIEFKRIPQ